MIIIICRMGSSALLAALSVPLEGSANELIFDLDIQTEKNLQLATLLTFGTPPVIPSRSALLDELVIRSFLCELWKNSCYSHQQQTTKSVANQVYPELSDFYMLMEKKFNPLQLVQSVKPKLEYIEKTESLKQYLKPIQKLLCIRLLQQVTSCYWITFLICCSCQKCMKWWKLVNSASWCHLLISNTLKDSLLRAYPNITLMSGSITNTVAWTSSVRYIHFTVCKFALVV